MERIEFNSIGIDTFFKLFGQNVTSLSIVGSCSDDTLTIIENCTQLKALKLKYCQVSRDIILKNLEELTLNNCCFDVDVGMH